MNKDFFRWHQKKATLNSLTECPYFHEREIWFFYLGANVGFEQDGSEHEFLRPVVVIKKFNNEIFWALPLTKSAKRLSPKVEPYYFVFSFVSGIRSLAILSQIRLIDARRLSRHIGTISEQDFMELMKKLKALLP